MAGGGGTLTHSLLDSSASAHRPKFLYLTIDVGYVWVMSRYNKVIIICVLESRVKTNHTSFDGKRMSPPLDKWTESCESIGVSTTTTRSQETFSSWMITLAPRMSLAIAHTWP
jgi:hypothetical protein